MQSIPPFLLALLGLLVVGGATHVAYLLVVHYRRGLSGRDAIADGTAEPIERVFANAEEPEPEVDADAADREFDPAATTIRCPRCNARNDATYSYCRECVAELDG